VCVCLKGIINKLIYILEIYVLYTTMTNLNKKDYEFICRLLDVEITSDFEYNENEILGDTDETEREELCKVREKYEEYFQLQNKLKKKCPNYRWCNDMRSIIIQLIQRYGEKLERWWVVVGRDYRTIKF